MIDFMQNRWFLGENTAPYILNSITKSLFENNVAGNGKAPGNKFREPYSSAVISSVPPRSFRWMHTYWIPYP